MPDYPVTPLTPPLTEQEIIRRQKLQKLLDAGKTPMKSPAGASPIAAGRSWKALTGWKEKK